MRAFAAYCRRALLTLLAMTCGSTNVPASTPATPSASVAPAATPQNLLVDAFDSASRWSTNHAASRNGSGGRSACFLLPKRINTIEIAVLGGILCIAT